VPCVTEPALHTFSGVQTKSSFRILYEQKLGREQKNGRGAGVGSRPSTRATRLCSFTFFYDAVTCGVGPRMFSVELLLYELLVESDLVHFQAKKTMAAKNKITIKITMDSDDLKSMITR